MSLYKNKYRVESVRLNGWDYSAPGYYFITVCTKNRECLFGEIINGEMMPNEYGEILENCWNDLPNHYPNLKLDQFAVMPDITDKTHGLFEFIRALKTFTARRINEHRQTPGIPVWQSRFHDHIIRDENELNRIRKYIIDNPANWGNDDNNITEVTP
ncbi:MAG TPA: transposase [Spirochaetia bacterium]|nr:transposase [Spirochaetia bacterium]